jgi:hypothetical protein
VDWQDLARAFEDNPTEEALYWDYFERVSAPRAVREW